MNTMRWQGQLPEPVAFAFSGGASLGAVQVGQLRAVQEAGIEPDLVVGTSVGSLNGAIVADRGVAEALPVLEGIWRGLRREDIFPGGIWAQALCLIRTRLNLFREDRLGDLICETLSVGRIEELRLPLGALATELLTHRGRLFTQGWIRPALLASAALPGVYPPQRVGDTLFIDGGLTANVPIAAAEQMGAGSIVVFDAGNTCRRREPPRHVAELMASAMHAALRQRVHVEAFVVAERLPVLYLPVPCVMDIGLLDFGRAAELIEQSYQLCRTFLAEVDAPEPGKMCGSPHFHDEDLMMGRAIPAEAV